MEIAGVAENLTIRDTLKKTFGYDSFRPMQEDIIRGMMEKRDALVVMPTGGGKSLTYQLPALHFRGLTIVVSPLISLMKDQVEQLQQMSVPAAFLNSSLSAQQYEETRQMVRRNQLKLLYLAPETLLMDRTLALIGEQLVEALVIDEAHCISEWGHDFRPEYRKLTAVRKQFPGAVCTALTATATKRVREDIGNILEIPRQNRFISSFDRKNLFLEARQRARGFEQIFEFLQSYPNQSGIIYCLTRRKVEELADFLHDEGFSAAPYHAGLSDEERRKNQELFIRDDLQIIVATVAFGMGINKPNVRFVIHHDLPKNLESYYQEIGRAGRDGLPSHCLLLYNYGDMRTIKYFIDQKEEAEKRVAENHLQAMLDFAEGISCRRKPLLGYFGEHYKGSNCGNCDNCSNTKAESVDLTKEAQMFLSAVKRTGERFGALHIIDVLRGSKAKKILKFDHHKIPTWGIGKEYSDAQWRDLARQFIQNALLIKDMEYGVLKLTEEAWKILRGENSYWGAKPAVETKIIQQKKISRESNPELFEELRQFRKQRADRQGVPPYVIFHDKTLEEMSAKMPLTEEEFLLIGGIGNAKAAKYGPSFLKIIREYAKKNNMDIEEAVKPKRKKKNRESRYHIVGRLISNGKTITEICEQYNIKQQTVYSHLYKYLQNGESIDVKYLLELSQVSSDVFDRIQKAFSNFGVFELKPVYDALNGEVSYEELHLQRIIFLANNTN